MRNKTDTLDPYPRKQPPAHGKDLRIYTCKPRAASFPSSSQVQFNSVS